MQSRGKNKVLYTYALEQGLQSIIGKKEEGIMSLFTSGGTNLDGERLKALEDFELITYLVIK